MTDQNDEIHLDAEEASAGTKPGVTRYVLIVSMTLVIVIFAVLLWHPFG